MAAVPEDGLAVLLGLVVGASVGVAAVVLCHCGGQYVDFLREMEAFSASGRG